MGREVSNSVQAAVQRRMPGRVPFDRVASVEVPRHPVTLAERLMALPDVTSAVADALDEVGIGAVLGHDSVAPFTAGGRMCGPAITIRYLPVNGDVAVNRSAGDGLIIGDRDLYGLAQPGDVAVFDCSGLRHLALMGGLSATWAAKAGLAGALVDGGVRDTATIRSSGVPVWGANRTPLAGRYRVEAVAINAEVSVSGARVRPGDYVVADDDGVCLIPHASFPAIVEACAAGQLAEDELMKTIEISADIEDLVHRTRSRPQPD